MKRKDNRGRVLKTGESQRKDLIYQYRYTDSCGKRHTVYAPTLEGLRKKEEEINRTEMDGASYHDGGITVVELLERCISLKQGVSYGEQRRFTSRESLKGENFLMYKWL